MFVIAAIFISVSIQNITNSVAQPLADLVSPASAVPAAIEQDALEERQVLADIFGTPERMPDLDPDMVALGQRLFHEPKLSSNGLVSCATCHVLADGGDDNRARSLGVSGRPSGRNSPTVYNLNGHAGYFWDGRATSLEEQIDGPLHHPDEMGSDWMQIIQILRQDSIYSTAFQSVFGGSPTEARVKEAIVTFELSLVTDDAPFDAYLAGDAAAMSAEALSGLELFMDLGCASCHQGPLFGGNVFQVFGVYEAYDHSEAPDTVFKVPSLRNVTETAPYFHDGGVDTLEQAVRTMSRHQLGHELSEDETSALVAFLDSLTSLSLRRHSVAAPDGPQ